MSDRLYRASLRAYPPGSRRAFGEQMAQVFADHRRDAGVRAWLRALSDMALVVPVLRWEERTLMTRRMAPVLFVLVAVVGGATAVLGLGSAAMFPVVMAAGALAVAAIYGVAHLVARSRLGAERDYTVGRARWWWVLAGALGMIELAFAVGQLVSDPKPENVFALGAMAAFAGLVAVGIRSGNRVRGNWMIATGVLPFVPFIWFPPAPVAALTVIVCALAENVRIGKVRSAGA